MTGVIGRLVARTDRVALSVGDQDFELTALEVFKTAVRGVPSLRSITLAPISEIGMGEFAARTVLIRTRASPTTASPSQRRENSEVFIVIPATKVRLMAYAPYFKQISQSPSSFKLR